MKKMFAIVLALMLCVSVLSVTAFAADNVIIRAKVPADWENVGAYTWEPEDFGAWPGATMTKNGDWYEITMPGTHTTVIINSANGQTTDLTIDAGKDVWIVVGEAGADGKYAASVSYEEPGNDVVVPPVDDTPVTPAPAGDYYVAGSAALCGVEWDPAAAANKMTLVDGKYTITYKDVAPGKYSLKVTDGTWNNSWGGNGENGNFDFEITETCDVTVEFDPSIQDVTVIAGEAILGDVSLAAVSVALLAATAGLVVVVSKKKEF